MDNFSSEKSWVPKCVLLLKSLQKDNTPNPLEYKVKLLGTGGENDFLEYSFTLVSTYIVYENAEQVSHCVFSPGICTQSMYFSITIKANCTPSGKKKVT